MLDVVDGTVTPLRFTDPRREHLATRGAAALFDFSFMGCFEITGPDALAYLQHLQVRNLQGLHPGRIMYTLLCQDDGSVFNDATVWRHDDGSYWLFTGRRSDVQHLQKAAAGFHVTLTDCSGRFAIIAVQGPASAAVVECCVSRQQLDKLSYYSFICARFLVDSCWIARLGYTGERGYELVTDAANGPELWDKLLAAGRTSGLMECGFEAANSLRIEAGHILFKRELAAPVMPYELRLARLVSCYGVDYIGSQALKTLRWRMPTRQLVGLLPDEEPQTPPTRGIRFKPEERQNVRPGTGYITSVCMSPVFERPLALGFVAYEDRYPGTRVRLTNGQSAEVARLPFYDSGKILPRR